MGSNASALSRRRFLVGLGWGSCALALAMPGTSRGLPAGENARISAMEGKLGSMLDKVCASDFEAYLGDTFLLFTPDNRTLKVELIEVEECRKDPGLPAFLAQRPPFSLVFRGPEGCTLPQKTYPMKHGKLGRFQLFLVPIGPFQGELRLEAIFN